MSSVVITGKDGIEWFLQPVVEQSVGGAACYGWRWLQRLQAKHGTWSKKLTNTAKDVLE